MDGIKQYEIKINGLSQSISQVDALTKKLDALEKRLNSLPKGSIGGAGGSSKSELKEEDRLLKDIDKTTSKILETKTEEYKVMQQQKQLLKESKKEVEETIAKERVLSAQYDNTIKGWKQELKDIKAVMQSMNPDDAGFTELTKRADELNSKLKDVETSYGQFGRNVGNYQNDIEKALKNVTVSVGGVERKFSSTREASRTLTNELKAMHLRGEENTQEYKELAKALDDYIKKLKGAESAVNDLNKSSSFMDSMLDLGQSFTAIGQMGRGFGVLFGMDSGAIDKSIQQMMALQNAMMGLEKIRQQMITGEGIGKYLSDISNSFSGLTNAISNYDIDFNKAITSTKASKVVLGEFAVGMKGLGTAVAGAVAELGAMFLIMQAIEQLPKWWKGSSEAINWEEKFGKQIERTNKALEERSNEVRKLTNSGDYTEYEKKLASYTKETNDALEEQYRLLKNNAQNFLSSNEINPGVRKQYNALYAGLTGEDFEVTVNGIDKVVTSVKEASKEMELLRQKAIAGNKDARDSYAQLAAYINGKWKKDMLDALNDARGNATKMKEVISQMYEEAERNPVLIDALHDVENNFLQLDGTARAVMKSMDSEAKMFADTIRGNVGGAIDDLMAKYDGIINSAKPRLQQLQEQLKQLQDEAQMNFGNRELLNKNAESQRVVMKQIADERARLASQNRPSGGRRSTTSTSKSEADMEKEKEDFILSITIESHEKRLAVIENARQRALETAKKYKVDEEQVNAFYNNQIEEENKRHEEELLNAKKNSLQMLAQTTSQMLQLQLQLAETQDDKIEAINRIEQDNADNITQTYNGLIEQVETLIREGKVDIEVGEEQIRVYRELLDLKLRANVQDANKRRSDVTGATSEEDEGKPDDPSRWFKKVNEYLMPFGNALQSYLSSFYQYENSLYQAMIESIDKDIDKARDKYQQLTEIAKEHADNVNSIESELANARGDRREALIDQLNAEMAAQRAKLEEERAAENEMKKLEAKKQQEELKQRKREQKQAETQAVISGALSIANGFATYPFIPKGLAMGALAAVLTGAQVALIRKQKFADGGLLEGNSHANGGIPVGNTGIEVEGNEFVTNKKTSMENLQLMEFVNSKRRKLDIGDFIEFYSSGKAGRNITKAGRGLKFADGGSLPTLRTDIEISSRLADSLDNYANRPVYVSVVDINKKQRDVQNVQVLAGIEK